MATDGKKEEVAKPAPCEKMEEAEPLPDGTCGCPSSFHIYRCLTCGLLVCKHLLPKHFQHALTFDDTYIYNYAIEVPLGVYRPGDHSVCAYFQTPLRYSVCYTSHRSTVEVPCISLNSVIYIIGGRSEDSVLSAVTGLVIDSMHNAHSLALAPMLIGRARHSAAAVDGAILVAGGLSSENVPLSHCELYLPQYAKWFEVAPMAFSRVEPSLVRRERTVLAFDGAVNSNSQNVVEVFSKYTRKWETVKIVGSKLDISALSGFVGSDTNLIFGGRKGTESLSEKLELKYEREWEIVPGTEELRLKSTHFALERMAGLPFADSFVSGQVSTFCAGRINEKTGVHALYAYSAEKGELARLAEPVLESFEKQRAVNPDDVICSQQGNTLTLYEIKPRRSVTVRRLPFSDYCCGITVLGNSVYISGGMKYDIGLYAFMKLVFDESFQLNSITLPSMHHGRGMHSSILVLGKFIYLVGGMDEGVGVRVCERFSVAPESADWTLAPALPEYVSRTVACCMDQRYIYAFDTQVEMQTGASPHVYRLDCGEDDAGWETLNLNIRLPAGLCVIQCSSTKLIAFGAEGSYGTAEIVRRDLPIVWSTGSSAPRQPVHSREENVLVPRLRGGYIYYFAMKEMRVISLH